MSNEQRIHRLVIDEAHQILTAGGQFRPKLKQIDVLRTVSLPKIYLSATISPDHHQKDFIENIGMNTGSVKVIRAPTGRRELQYHQYKFQKADHILAFVHRFTYQSYLTGIVRSDSRVIIFCRQVADAETISKSLGCLKYYGSLGQDERTETQTKWMAGATSAHRCIAATSAFVHGIDAPYVDLIIFINAPFGAVDFVQAAARGGRRGRPCVVVLAHMGTKLTVPQKDYSLADIMNKVTANTTQCRRLLLTEAMDGEARKCMTESFDQLCDICQPNTPITELMAQCASGPLPNPACLQNLPGIQPAIAQADEDDYMFGDFDDADLAQVEMPAINGTGLPTGQAFIQSDNIARTGMQLEAASGRLDKAERMDQIKDLSKCLDQLCSKCPVCWALG
ncbi:hypothetical protein EVJ58_g11129, partial [Rhodofomes roseus]